MGRTGAIGGGGGAGSGHLCAEGRNRRSSSSAPPALGSRLSALELPEWGLQLPQVCRHLREDTALPFPN